jgi:hypothetical protein
LFKSHPSTTFALGVHSSPLTAIADSRIDTPFCLRHIWPSSHGSSFCPIPVESSDAFGVGSQFSMTHDEHSVSSVRCSNGASWNKYRLDFISMTFKVVADSFKGKGLSQLELSSNIVSRVE